MLAAPFVYQDIQALTASYYLATLADTEQVVLYDRDFCAADAMIWDSSKWEKPLLTLTKGEDSFQYSLEKDVLQLVQVEMSRKTDDFSFSVSSEKLNAALLSPEEWRLSLDQMTQFLTIGQNAGLFTIAGMHGPGTRKCCPERRCTGGQQGDKDGLCSVFAGRF